MAIMLASDINRQTNIQEMSMNVYYVSPSPVFFMHCKVLFYNLTKIKARQTVATFEPDSRLRAFAGGASSLASFRQKQKY